MTENNIDWIKTVKMQEDGYLVNGSMSVPNSAGNRHYQEVQDWLKDNTPEPEFSEEEIFNRKQQAFNNAIQTHLDTKAKEFRYDNIMSARSYAGYDNQFQEEAQKLAVWASNCWVKAGEIDADVKAGNRDIPTIDEVLDELPSYEDE